jgi:hypothetical protein
VCPDPALPFPPSKRRHGSTGLAPWKVLKTVSASAASAASSLAGRLASSQDAPKRGAQAAQVVVGRVPEADPSVEATVVPREAAGAAAASSPPGGLPVLAVEPPVAADVEMVEAPPLKVGDREPAPWLRGYPMRRLREVPAPWRREAQNRGPSWGAATLSSRGKVSMSGVGRGSGSGPVVPRNPSSFLTMSERSRLGASFVSVPRRWWGRSGRPWRSFPGTFPGSSR